jgi:hypothetical protein
MNAQRLKHNFAQVAGHGLEVADYFYADLFARNNGYRSLFPASMARQHAVLVEALTQIVTSVDKRCRGVVLLLGSVPAKPRSTRHVPHRNEPST